MPSFDPFDDIKNALPTGWRVHNAGSDKALVISPTGEQVTIPLRPYEEAGAFGRVWMTGQRVIQPSITATYNTQTGTSEFSGSTSAQEVAYRLKTASHLAKTRRTSLGAEWTRLLMQGSEADRISPTPTLAYNENPSVHRSQALSMAMRFMSDRETGIAWKEEIGMLQRDFGRMMGMTSQGIPGVGANAIQGNPDAGGYGLTWERLNRFMMTPSKEGHLIPLALPYASATGAGWQMQKDPSKLLKAPSLQVKGGTAQPFRVLDTGGIQPIMPGVTTNANRPAYAYSNVLDEFGNRFAGKRMSAVLGTHPIPGAGTLYEDPEQLRIGETFWGAQSHEFAPIQNTNVLDLLSGKASISLHEKLLSRTYGAGIPVSELGTVTTGPDAAPEPIRGRFGPSTFHPATASFLVPEYINKMTGEAAEPDEAFLQGNPGNIISTQSLLPGLQERLGMPVMTDKNRPMAMGLQMAGTMEAAVALKARDIKVGQYGVGETQNINLYGREMPVTLHTAELKGPAMAISSLGEKSPTQLMGIMGDFAMRSGMSADQARNFLGYFRKHNMARANEGMPMDVNMNNLARVYSRLTGTERMSGGIFAAKMYDTVFMNQSAEGDIRNLARYGEASAGGADLFSGVWHPEQYQWLQNEYSRAYRATNKGATNEQIQAAFNQQFISQPQKNGFTRLQQRTSATDRYSNIIMPTTQEWVHGSDVGVEFQMAASGRYPGFAKELGINIENLVPRGDQQTSKWGMAMYAAFQGQRRDEYTAHGTLQMPSKYQSVSRETLMNISAFLGGGGKDMSALEKTRWISENALKDVPADSLLWSEDARTFLPNPKSILGSTFEENGIESAQVAKVYNQAMESVGQLVSPDLGLDPDFVRKEAIDATSGLYNYVSSVIGGSGDFLKGMLSRNTNQAIGGNMTFDPTVAPNEVSYSRGLLGNVARQMGFFGRSAGRAIRQMMTNPMQMLMARWPIPSEEGVQAMTSQTMGQKVAAMGQAAYRAVSRNPLLKNVVGVSGAYAQANIGDFDYDKWLSVLGIQRNGDELSFINDQQVADNQLTLERAREIEQTYFQDEEFRNIVNAPVNQLMDMIGGKNVVGGALKEAIAASKGKRFSPAEVIARGFEVMQSSGIGMGVGYNPRRAIAGTMGAAGYSNEELAYVMSSVPSEYQPALDRLLKGRFASGVPSAAVIAQSYFGVNDKDQAYLHMGSTGQGTERINRKGPNGEILPPTRSPGVNLALRGDLGLLDNRIAMMQGTSFLVKQFAEGAELNKGGNARMSVEQVAARFALPGERKILAEAMKEDPKTWDNTIQAYYGDVLLQHGLKSGLSKIFQTPQWGGVITQALTKARNSTDPVAKTEQVPGAEEAGDLFLGEMPEDVRQNFIAGRTYNAIARRGRDSNLRAMLSGGVNAMVGAFPEDSVLGKFARSVARGLNVAQNAPDEIDMAFPPPSEQLKGEMEYFQSRRYRDAKSEGYEGSFEDFQRMESRQNQEVAANPTMHASAAGGGGDAGIPNDPTTPADPADPGEPGGKKPKRQRKAKAAATTGTDVHSGSQGGTRRKTSVSKAERLLGEQATKPKDIQLEAEVMRMGTAQRVGYDIMGRRLPAIQAYENMPSFTEQVGSVLGRLGYIQEGETVTDELISERARQARVEDPYRFFGAFSKSQLKQGASIAKRQQDIAYTQMFMDTNPLVNRQEAGKIIGQAQKGNLNRDISTIGYLFSEPTKPGDRPIDMTAEQVDKLTAAYERQTKALKAVDDAQGKVTQKVDHEARAANAGAQSAVSGFMADSAQARMNELMSGVIKSGKPTLEDLKEMKSLQGIIRSSRRDEATAAQEESEWGGKGYEKWGSAARRMLGGFGLMYLSSIGNFATQGLGYGMAERQAFDQAGSRGAYQFTGAAQVPYNQQSVLNTNMALYGVNNDPRSAFKSFAAEHPMARDIWGAGAAGLGVWGYTQFAAGQIGGASGAALAGAALPLAVAAGGASMLLDANARLQDQQGLAWRQATGKFGINDYAALGMMKGVDLSKYQAQEGFYEEFHKAAQAGAPTTNLMNFQYSYQPNPAKNPLSPRAISDALEGPGSIQDAQAVKITNADRFFALQREVAERYKGFSQESQVSGAGFLLRSGMSTTDERLKNVLSDYELGGFAAEASQSVLGALGYNQAKMYAKGAGQEFNRLSQMQLGLANRPISEEEKALLSSGVQFAGQIPGMSRLPGMGASAGGTQDLDKILDFMQKLGQIAGTTAGEIYQSEMGAYTIAQQAGLRNVKAPDIDQFVGQEFTPEQQARRMAQTGAIQSQAQNRLSIAGNLASGAARFGNLGLGMSMYDTVMQTTPGKEWMTNRMFNADPMALAAFASSGFNMNKLAGATTMQGGTINPNYLAFTDMMENGQLSGLAWGTTSMRLGSLSSQQMAGRIFGGMQSDAVNAAVNGQDLLAPITLPNGQKISRVGGQMGMQAYANQLRYQQQEKEIGFQRRGFDTDYAYQFAMWGIQDRQRDLSHSQAQAGFGFQERGQTLARENIAMQSAQWSASTGLNREQQMTNRSWTRQDWGRNDYARNLQWGWQQEDFDEESRFLTGRQRRVAERNRRRQTTMHNIEEEGVSIQRNRQGETWEVEDKRFALEKKHHEEQLQSQTKSLNLQTEQLASQRMYYEEGKKLEDEMIKLQRQHWLDQHKLAEEQLALNEKNLKAQLDIAKAFDQMNVALELTKGQLSTIADDGLTKFQESLVKSKDALLDFVNDTGSSSRSVVSQASSGRSSQGSQTINVYLGNKLLQSYISDVVSDTLNLR